MPPTNLRLAANLARRACKALEAAKALDSVLQLLRLLRACFIDLHPYGAPLSLPDPFPESLRLDASLFADSAANESGRATLRHAFWWGSFGVVADILLSGTYFHSLVTHT